MKDGAGTDHADDPRSWTDDERREYIRTFYHDNTAFRRFGNTWYFVSHGVMLDAFETRVIADELARLDREGTGRDDDARREADLADRMAGLLAKCAHYFGQRDDDAVAAMMAGRVAGLLEEYARERGTTCPRP